MTLLALFRYEVKPGRMDDFMAKLGQAIDPRFDSPVMPSGITVYRSARPGPDAADLVLAIEYPDLAAYDARTAFEQGNAEWRALFGPIPDSPERLIGVELLEAS